MSKEVKSFIQHRTETLKKAVENLEAGTEKSVTVILGDDALREARDNHYKLCFAKRVGNNAFNVIWQSYDRYSSCNTLSWIPQYEVFGSEEFRDAQKVVVNMNPVDIGIGQMTTLDDYGIFSEAADGGEDPEALNIINEHGAVHLGVNQISYLGGKAVVTPIFLSRDKYLSGTVSLTPVDEVMVWFESEAKTSTMFSKAKSKSIVIDLTKKDSQTVEYVDEKWAKR